jgi:peptidoglycan L-alanyl-D-glutamate endopeptidase CwlK
MNSKHLTGHAVDLGPYPLDWNDIAGFDAIANAMLRAASQLGVHLRYGGDWDGDGKRREKGENDSPHWELDERGVLTA